MDAAVERVEPCLVERRNRTDGLSEPRMSRPKLTVFVLVVEAHRFSVQCVFGREIIHKKHDFVNKNFTCSDIWLILELDSFNARDVDS
jgi:hypothetical protein